MMIRGVVLGAAVLAGDAMVQDRFTIVLLPDTQYYSLRDPRTYFEQTEWIAAKRDVLDVEFVVHLGDVTDKNGLDESSLAWQAEWLPSHRAHLTLDAASIPYTITTGNHDYPWTDLEDTDRRVRDASMFNWQFSPSRFQGTGWYKGHFSSGNENSYAFFEHDGLQFMVVSLEYAPRKDAMCWADSVLRQFPARRAIVATHCYQGSKGGLVGDCDQARYRMTGASPVAIWQELVRPNPNVFMVVSGHINGSAHRMRNRMTQDVVADDASGPTTVHEILTDYQEEPGLNAAHLTALQRVMDNHGNGWLKTMEFRPAEKRVYVSTHSVLGADTFVWGPRERRYNKNPGHIDHKYDFRYDMTAPPPTMGAPRPDRFEDRVVNSDKSGDQLQPAATATKNGEWVGVWQDSRGNDGYRVRVRGFDANGCQRFSDRAVHTGLGPQRHPAVASDNQGRFVVVWEDGGGDEWYQIQARGFDGSGAQRADFPLRTVNANATGQQLRPAVAMKGDGTFVVVWEDDSDKDGTYKIMMRGFDAAGTPRPDFPQRAVSDGKGQQRRPVVAMDKAGRPVVVWEDSGTDDVYQIKMRGFDTSGNPRQDFPTRTVNEVATGQQRRPSVVIDLPGNVVVAWEDSGGDDVYQIRMRGFDASGAPRQDFEEQTVNTTATGQQRKPEVAMRPNGQFIVAWEDSGDDGYYQIKARAFQAGGDSPWDQQVTVNTLASGQQRSPAVAMDPSGRFVVLWEDDLEKNDSWEVLARGCSLASRCAY